MPARKIKKVVIPKAVIEGAGVHLKRVFGYYELPEFDPFLLLDDFRSDEPSKYTKGFPWHPHRGIETITYLTAGEVEHGDSLGNKGVIHPGDVQWMTAGRGIIHQEMPVGDDKGRMHGFQLWANLPAKEKMMPPKYRDVVSSQIPVVKSATGVETRVIAGSFNGVNGPADDIVIDPDYFDVKIPASTEHHIPVKKGYKVFIYVIDGAGSFEEGGTDLYENRTLVLFDDGDEVGVKSGNSGVRFLFISGKPLNEPVAWGGPIVMNTQDELNKAFSELKDGTFIK